MKKAGGRHLGTGPVGRPSDRYKWITERAAASGVGLDRRAAQRIAEHMGEDAGQLPGLLATLVGVHGPDASLTEEDVEPYLGGAGGIPPWDLTDRIDEGDVPGALRAVERMMDGGGRHPLAIMATLQTHYERMLRLDGAGVTDQNGAAEVLGISPYPAKKAVDGVRRLGGLDGLTEVYQLLSRADVELRGRSGLEDRHVMEVLVGRLAQLSRRSSARPR